jgi:hypothetical protein
MATLKGPVKGGNRGWPFGAAAFDLGAFGYLEEEYFFEGISARYRHAGGSGRSFDGRWFAEIAAHAPFKSRILIRRPADPERFNGTVIALWSNVSRGYDIFLGESPQVYREGFAVALISAQRVGVHGFPLRPDRGLIGWDTARYGSLSIENDDYSYDIFTQAARLVGPDRPRSDVDPLNGLQVQRMLALGASQSAARLVTYHNAVQPIERIFDGFFIYLFFGNGALLEDPNRDAPLVRRVEDIIPHAVRMPAGSHLIRDDLCVPVFVLNTETESVLHYPVRREDSATYRFWEIAGFSHGSTALSDGLASHEPRDLDLSYHVTASEGPNNVLSHEPVSSAALHHLQRWLADGVPPPVQRRLIFTDNPPTLERDAIGIARGGIRLPQIEAPTAMHTGVDSDGKLQMFGTSIPLSADVLNELYASPLDWRQKRERAARAAVETGALLESDAYEIAKIDWETAVRTGK